MQGSYFSALIRDGISASVQSLLQPEAQEREDFLRKHYLEKENNEESGLNLSSLIDFKELEEAQSSNIALSTPEKKRLAPTQGNDMDKTDPATAISATQSQELISTDTIKKEENVSLNKQMSSSSSEDSFQGPSKPGSTEHNKTGTIQPQILSIDEEKNYSMENSDVNQPVDCSIKSSKQLENYTSSEDSFTAAIDPTNQKITNGRDIYDDSSSDDSFKAKGSPDKKRKSDVGNMPPASKKPKECKI